MVFPFAGGYQSAPGICTRPLTGSICGGSQSISTSTRSGKWRTLGRYCGYLGEAAKNPSSKQEKGCETMTLAEKAERYAKQHPQEVTLAWVDIPRAHIQRTRPRGCVAFPESPPASWVRRPQTKNWPICSIDCWMDKGAGGLIAPGPLLISQIDRRVFLSCKA